MKLVLILVAAARLHTAPVVRIIAVMAKTEDILWPTLVSLAARLVAKLLHPVAAPDPRPPAVRLALVASLYAKARPLLTPSAETVVETLVPGVEVLGVVPKGPPSVLSARV